MRFYTQQHPYCCGIDLHARSRYLYILDASGGIAAERNLASAAEPFLAFIAPYRDNLVVGVECIFTWHWLADLRARERIAFISARSTNRKPRALALIGRVHVV